MDEPTAPEKSDPPRWQIVVVWALIVSSAGIGAAVQHAFGGNWIDVLLTLAMSVLVLAASGHYRQTKIRHAATIKAEAADQAAFAGAVFMIKSTAVQVLGRRFKNELDDPEMQTRLLDLWRDLANTKLPEGVDKTIVDLRDWAGKVVAEGEATPPVVLH